VILDIGSASVLAAIIFSDPKNSSPSIIWSHREKAPLKNIDSLEQSAKAVTTALVNCSMILETEGRKALSEFDKSAKLTELQCTVSAPWSYTVTKSINYKQEEAFMITEELIEELEETIEKKVREELTQNKKLSELGLDLVSELTMGITANGYQIANPAGNRSKEVSIYQASTVIQQYLIDAIDELKDKLFPNTEVSKSSFITALYLIVKEVSQHTKEACLVDITYEATEIGIVRDGTLTYCTHIPFGSYTIAREISEITNVPLAEAFGYLHTDEPMSFLGKLPDKQKEEVKIMLKKYTDKVSALLHETGDALSIPGNIFVHADLSGEYFFKEMIRDAAKSAIKTDPHVTPISSEILGRYQEEDQKNSQKDTALLLSAQFFHIKPAKDSFEYM